MPDKKGKTQAHTLKPLSTSDIVASGSPRPDTQQIKANLETDSTYDFNSANNSTTVADPPDSIAEMSEDKTEPFDKFSDLQVQKDFSNDGVRDFSGSVQDRKKRFETMIMKPDHSSITSTTKHNDDQAAEELIKQAQTQIIGSTNISNGHNVESVSEQIHVDNPTLSGSVVKDKITQESIAQLQKDNTNQFNTELRALLKRYLPAPLFEPYPHSQPTTTTTPGPSTNTDTLSIIDMEVRRALSLATRNVYHAHMRDDRTRAEFDHEHAKLLNIWFGKGKRISNQMRKLAKSEKVKPNQNAESVVVATAADGDGEAVDDTTSEHGQSA